MRTLLTATAAVCAASGLVLYLMDDASYRWQKLSGRFLMGFVSGAAIMLMSTLACWLTLAR